MTWLEKIGELSEWGITVGARTFTILDIFIFIVLLCLVFLVASVVRKLLLSRVLVRTGMSIALQRVLSRFAGYLVILIGLFVALQAIGINLGSLAFLAGAFGLGLGFGLQNIISNFVSGLIILFERPIQVGDRIDVGEVQGDVVEIRARSTTIVTNDNITIIVPNSEFISSRVINWSHGDPKVRFKIAVGVSYGSDPKLVEKALLEAAEEVPDALKNPEPMVRFMEFGDSSLNFELRVWTDTLVQVPNKLRSQVNFKIFEKFKKFGIEIPFPQRDVYIKRLAPTDSKSEKTAKVAAAEHLRERSMFESLSDEDLAAVVERGDSRKYFQGQRIIQQGDEGDSLFIILKGIATAESKTPSGKVVSLGTLGKGDVFGEGSFLTGARRRTTITAASVVEAIEMCKDCLKPILEKNPDLAEQLSREMAEHNKKYDISIAEKDEDPTGKKDTAEDAHNVLQRVRSFFKLH